ncbi:FAS1-like dehydratase domain-containing protein [Actinomadura kijaniata]|uniref:FAS1-like dehydratase domain-containing protein n=1 Tax=Actinomadura kijaniata TaxID=46161 RepID=UPI00082A905C|nr:MaoC family dehydratase N-terminal domain-containing protein [Actinomadura kijaniata]
MIDIEGWSPAPHETTETIDAAPAAALAGLLDTDPPGPELPPLWQWLHFLDRPPQRDLGPDGHPLAGRHLPPIPDRRRMFAGGRLIVREPLRIGDTVTRRAELVSTAVKEGRSGELLFVTVRHTFLRDGTKIAVEEQDLVYRCGDQVGRPARPSFKIPETDAPWTLRMTADPVLLFRFSALTYNAHRIHYDETYATQVEGHPGLVVHGPLLAILCLELPRREGHKVTELSFRSRRPVYADQPFAVTGSPDGELAVVAPGGVTAMTATFS